MIDQRLLSIENSGEGRTFPLFFLWRWFCCFPYLLRENDDGLQRDTGPDI